MPDISKSGLREIFRERRLGMDSGTKTKASAEIAKRLIDLPEYETSRDICAYWPLEEEVDLRLFISKSIAAGKRLYLPRVNKEQSRLDFYNFRGDVADLSPGPFGIMEPTTKETPQKTIDLIIVPGLAFDMHGHRLGYGAGYYDKFLGNLDTFFAGVAFDIQTIDILPIAEHDIAMDAVITETRIIR